MTNRNMLKQVLFGMLAALIALPAGTALGATINVPGDQPTIQAAIDIANPVTNDEVVIADGTYTGAGNVNLDFGGKAITVRSANGPAAVIIDCQNSARGVYFQNGETPLSVLQGVTIRNGNADYGAAIRVANASSPIILNCILENNTATDGGGAVNVFGAGSNPMFLDSTISGNTNQGANGAGGGFRIVSGAIVTIIGCTIEDNEAVPFNGSGSGGGISVNGAILEITDSVISNNHAGYNGGAIAVDGVGSTATIEGCRIYGNTADNRGGALRFSYTVAPIDVINCLIYDNLSLQNGAVVDSYQGTVTLSNCTITRNTDNNFALFHAHYLGAPFVTPAVINVANSIIYGNTATNVMEIDNAAQASVTISWSDVDDAAIAAVNNNINADPLFENAALNNFMLQSTSPAIDAGDNTAVPADTLDIDGDMNTAEPVPYDLYGAVRFFDVTTVGDTGNGMAPIVDMGAFEHGNGALQFSAAVYNVSEGGGSITVSVTRSGGSDGAISVDYDTSNGTAVAGTDYTAASGTLNWANGDNTPKTFVIPISDDSAVEGNENVNLGLSNPGGGSVLADLAAAVLVIIDNDTSGGGGGGGGGCFISSISR